MFLIDTQTHEAHELTVGATIGRDDSASIVLRDRTVSRQHALIEGNAMGFVLKDLGSRTGTFVDERRITSAPLTPGCIVRMGSVRLSVSDSPETTVSLDPRVAPLSKIEFRPAYAIDDPIALRNDYERLRMVFELTRAIDIQQNIDVILEKILTTAFRLLSAERGIIQLFECTGLARMSAQTRAGPVDDLSLSQTVIQEAIRDRKGLIVANAQTHTVFSRAESICADGVRSVMCVPMLYDETVLGVIQVDSQHATHAFDERDLVLFSVIASRAAVIIQDVATRAAVVEAKEAELIRHQRVLDQLPMAIVIITPEGMVNAANAAGRAALAALSVPDGAATMSLGGKSIESLRSMAPDTPTPLAVSSSGPTYMAHSTGPSDGETVLWLAAASSPSTPSPT